MLKKLGNLANTRLGLFIILTVLFWLKNLLAYFVDFNLGESGLLQFILLIINPLGSAILLGGIAFYFKKSRYFYPVLLGIEALNTLLLYLNVIYYREFTDFMTIATMMGYSKVNQGLSGSSLALTRPHDILFWLDLVVIIILMVMRKI
ncbi:MAG: LTA synthase family protein, partial [Limosilactobacillus sp.]|nr:LTA synthase family protein [Limosilactobacillus sp.]